MFYPSPTTPLHQKSTTTLFKRRMKDWTGLGHSRVCGERDGTRYQSFYAAVVWSWGRWSGDEEIVIQQSRVMPSQPRLQLMRGREAEVGGGLHVIFMIVIQYFMSLACNKPSSSHHRSALSRNPSMSIITSSNPYRASFESSQSHQQLWLKAGPVDPSQMVI